MHSFQHWEEKSENFTRIHYNFSRTMNINENLRCLHFVRCSDSLRFYRIFPWIKGVCSFSFQISPVVESRPATIQGPAVKSPRPLFKAWRLFNIIMIFASDSIWGRTLYKLGVYTRQTSIQTGVYTRQAFIQVRCFFEEGVYKRQAFIQGRRLFKEIR